MRSTINTVAFQRKVDDAVFGYLVKLGYKVKELAVDKVPVDEGTLMGVITVDETLKSEMRVRIGANLSYASPVEFGTWASRVPPFDSHTPGMKPRPYLRPALDEVIQGLRGRAGRR